MPTYRQLDENKVPRTVRAPFNRESYSVPADWIATLRANYGDYSVDEMLNDPQHPLGNMNKHGVIERDEKRFILLRHSGMPEFAIELELTGDGLGEIREVPPEDVWELVRKQDRKESPPIEVGPIDPRKMF